MDMIWQQEDGRMRSGARRPAAEEYPYPEERYGDRSERPGRSRKRRKKRHSFFRRLLSILLLLLAAAAGLWCYTVSAVYDQIRFVPVESLADAPAEADGVVNILLIGNDSRKEGETGRSDAMLLLSVSGRKICMTSFLRDMYVKIPGHDDNRLNMAYAYGGPELLMETLKLNFGIDVNRYILVNFQAFAHLVDAAGGVDLELTREEVVYVNGYLAEYNTLENRPAGTDYLDETLSGQLHLNGPQALAYCRNRYIGTDFARTGRQRKVLSAILKQAPAALPAHFGDLLHRLPGDLTTNLTKGECLRLSLQVPAAATGEIVMSSVPADGTFTDVTIRKMAVLQVDFEENRRILRQNIYGDGASE